MKENSEKNLIRMMNYLCRIQEGNWFSWNAKVTKQKKHVGKKEIEMDVLEVNSFPALLNKIKKLFKEIGISQYFDFKNVSSYGDSYPYINNIEIPIIQEIPEETLLQALDTVGFSKIELVEGLWLSSDSTTFYVYKLTPTKVYFLNIYDNNVTEKQKSKKEFELDYLDSSVKFKPTKAFLRKTIKKIWK